VCGVILPDSRKRDGALERRLDRLDWLTIEFNDVITRDPGRVPAAQMREQARRDRNWRLSFVRLTLPLRQPIKDAVCEVDKGPAFRSDWRSSRDSRRARASVDRKQNEARQMA